jgi:hypothetical protein
VEDLVSERLDLGFQERIGSSTDDLLDLLETRPASFWEAAEYANFR